MEKTIVTTGKTIELAIEAALQQLHLDRDSVSVEVLKNAKSGFLGFGAAPAKVQVTYEVPDPVPAKPEAPKSALGSASRSKPKAKVEAPAAQSGVISRPGKKIKPEEKPAKKSSAKKTAEKKPAAKKTADKKTAEKKTTTKKTAAKKPAEKKTTTKKAAKKAE